MNEQGFKQLIAGGDRSTPAVLARFGLRCLAIPYRIAIRMRNATFDLSMRTPHQAAVPVISVGNLTTGGTGKTPLVALIANRLTGLGQRPCLLSRGYRSLDESGNDEKLLLERLCPGVPHLQDPDRVEIAEQAVRQHRATALLLDDGFQHRRLSRDLDIVVIDATNPFGHGYVLPRGLLREPISGLSRADLLCVTRCNQVSEESLAETLSVLQRYDAPVIQVEFRPVGFVTASGESREVELAEDFAVGAFCGIGNPESFQGTLQSLGVAPQFFHALPDHCAYAPADLAAVATLVSESGVNVLVCTEKDLVKISDGQIGGAEVLAVRIGAVVTDGEDRLMSAITAALAV